jgi:hypothetical protein
MSIKNTNTLGVLRALCRRHHFVSGEIQDYLLEMALNKNLAEIPCLRALRELSG